MRQTAIALAVIAVVIPGVVWIADFLAVDSCLDSGGVFDFSTGQCSFTMIHGRYVFFPIRHPLLVLASAAVGISAIALYVVSKRRAAVA